jgi:hypothetical protein
MLTHGQPVYLIPQPPPGEQDAALLEPELVEPNPATMDS